MTKENIQELSFAEVIGDRFGRYSKYIIQDRALPDIRDGLKPVQRRILFAMYQDNNTASNPYRKSARTVGNVIGNLHPHGDYSVYEAMVRLSQDWKLREPLIDMHGNNGSMDGDPAAAMRYTEARLSPIASLLLQDLEYETVDYQYNFDDTMQEPVVLPARFPNLLVNGATGISAGYATEIPPHNITEVIDAIIYMLQNKDYTLDDLCKLVKGPDFPTGGIIQGANNLKKIYSTGQGKIVIRSVCEIEKIRGNKEQIAVTQLPYDVNKARLVQKLDDIRIGREIEGIAEVRDESDRDGVRLVIELRRGADSEGVLNYLLLNTDLQVNYHFNMVAIKDRRPELVGLIDILEAYISHQQEVITRRTKYQLNKHQDRLHIVEGYIYMMSILDEVVHTIRNSQNRKDAVINLVNSFEFSNEQAEAIVQLQLYRLTNTDIVALQEEKLDLNEAIKHCKTILSKKEALNGVLINELEEIKDKFKNPRRTKIEQEVEEISVEQHVLIQDEQVYVSVTNEGYIKRTSMRSFQASQVDNIGIRGEDYAIYIEEMSTHDSIIILTNRGNYIHIPVHELPDIRWADLGVHWSQKYKLEPNESILAVFKASSDDSGDTLVFATKNGMIKQSEVKLFETYRSYKTKTQTAMNLNEGDEVIDVTYAKKGTDYEVALLTKQSYGLRYPLDEVSNIGLRTKGVISVNLHDDDEVVAAFIYPKELEPQIFAVTQRGNAKRFSVLELADVSRASRGMKVLRDLKTNSHYFTHAILLEQPGTDVNILGDTGYELVIKATEIPLTERLNNGSSLEDLDKLGKIQAVGISRLKSLEADEEEK